MASGVSRIDAAIAREGGLEDENPGSATAATNPAVTRGAEFRSRLHWFIGAADVRTQDPGSLTYEPYYGLREKPFSLSSDPRFFFSQSSHGAAFDALAAGVRRREGILVLTGEVGTGKTTLCRAVLQSLDQKTFAAFAPDPFLSREDLLKTLLVDFGVVSVDEIRSGRLRGATRTDLSYPLYDFLTSLQPLKAFAVVMIDEAQNLSSELLEEIRILSDLENGQKLLEVVLVGQPELQTRLATSGLRQLSQRVSIRCELTPLVRADIKRYVSHRLTVAGNDGRLQFTDTAIDFIWAASKGNPRVINLVCDRALACAARARTMSVNAEHVVWAADDLDLPGAGAFDLAPAVESFPKEFPKALPTTVDQPPRPQAESLVPAQEPPADPFKSFLKESWQPPAERENQPQPAEVRVTRVRRRQRIWMAPAGVSLVFIAGFAAIWYSTAPASPQQPDALEQPAPAGISRSASADDGASSSAAPDAGIGTSAPGASSANGASPTGAGGRDEVHASALAPSTAGFALQMATFQSSARAAEAAREFRDAGYPASSVERSLRDGTGVHAVILGPYTTRDAAEIDRERVREIPGYGDGLIVPIGPAALPEKIQ